MRTCAFGTRFQASLFTTTVALATAAWNPFAVANGARLPERVDFNRDVRPILSDACFRCHGPDAPTRKAGLRLDTEEGIKADLGGYRAIKPGDEDASELVKRIVHVDADERMPPVDAPRQLNAREVQVLRLWVKQGAPWAEHWSFTPPSLPPVPLVNKTSWPTDDIDRFVLSKLEQEGLSPSADASASTLLRRLSLDLTGLPPTVAEQAEFDRRFRQIGAKVWPEVVDRLLASDAYAEHMTAHWMNVARYADTNGYQKDDVRQMWRWRDWVLKAFGSNMPFDKFTFAQTAGDLLPNATLDDHVATGFHRNHRSNSEGGSIDAEFRAEYIADRVDTTATVWLGLTLGCARCHDHKYDPLSQRDYYRFAAFFASVPERGRVVGNPNARPYVLAPTEAQSRRLQELQAALAVAERRVVELRPEAVKLSRRWASSTPDKGPPPNDGSFLNDGLRGALSLNGQSSHSLVWLGSDEARFSGDQPFSMIFAGVFSQTEGILAAQQETDVDKKGWVIAIRNGELHIELNNRWLDDGLRLKSVRKLSFTAASRLAVTYDGGRYASGLAVWLDGKPVEMLALLDSFVNGAATNLPITVGGEAKSAGGLPLEFRVYDRVLSAEEIKWLAVPESLSALARKKVLTSGEEAKLLAGWWQLGANDDYKSIWQKVIDARHELWAYTASLPTTMVLANGPARRTYVLTRGEYDKPGAEVSPGIPALWNKGDMKTRLELAQWLTSAQNPLTARVFVNRLWQMMFGTGIVATSDNFGLQGEAPSHPHLLDHLAVTFVESGWNVKALLKRMALSRTYRQTSDVSPRLLQRDPNNRLLARAPRLRLPAEVIRDQSLAAAGLLHRQVGGASVKFPQPFGVWEDNGGPRFVAAPAPDRYRRSVYAFWKRTAPPPSLATFDAPSRESCAVRPTRTNTPLQALAMMNDPVQVEAAQSLAQSARAANADVQRTDEAFVDMLFVRVLARHPCRFEARHLRRYLQAERAFGTTVSTQTSKISPDVLAAMLVLNLDETINRP